MVIIKCLGGLVLLLLTACATPTYIESTSVPVRETAPKVEAQKPVVVVSPTSVKDERIPTKGPALTRLLDEADQLIATQQFAQAQLKLERAIRIAPKVADSYALMARAYFMQERYREAANWARKGLSMPSESESRQQLEQLLVRSEQLRG